MSSSASAFALAYSLRTATSSHRSYDNQYRRIAVHPPPQFFIRAYLFISAIRVYDLFRNISIFTAKTISSGLSLLGIVIQQAVPVADKGLAPFIGVSLPEAP